MWTHVPLGLRDTVRIQCLHLGAQKAMVSALRACQAAHVFGGQLGLHAETGVTL